MEPPTNEQITNFCASYNWALTRGLVAPLGSSEFRRLFQDWLSQSKPRETLDFIVANCDLVREVLSRFETFDPALMTRYMRGHLPDLHGPMDHWM